MSLSYGQDAPEGWFLLEAPGTIVPSPFPPRLAHGPSYIFKHSPPTSASGLRLLLWPPASLSQ